MDLGDKNSSFLPKLVGVQGEMMKYPVKINERDMLVLEKSIPELAGGAVKRAYYQAALGSSLYMTYFEKWE